jgi:hypothetical protein
MGENSYFYSFLFNNTWSYFETRLIKKSLKEVEEFAIPTQNAFSDYQVALASALIKRMYEFCHEHNIKLIIVDIPGIVKIREPFLLLQTAVNYSDVYIASRLALSNYIGVAELHVPHGHKHISEFTHTILGTAIAEKIDALIQHSTPHKD